MELQLFSCLKLGLKKTLLRVIHAQGRNRAETIKSRRKVEYENRIARDAKNNKKRLFVYPKSFTRLSTHFSVIRLADNAKHGFLTGVLAYRTSLVHLTR